MRLSVPSSPSASVRRRAIGGASWIVVATVLAGALAWLLLARPWRATDAPPPPPVRASGVGFEDLAPEAGLAFRMRFLESEQGERFKVNLYDHGCGVAVADYDGDGDDDVYFANQLGANALFRNDGHGHFTDVTEAAGGLGLDDRICVASAFADVDDDGDQDLYVTSTRGGNAFFRNRGDGTFEERTEPAGLTLVAHSQQPAFFDADGDGHLDLLVTNTARWTTDTFDSASRHYVGPASLFDLICAPIEENRFYRGRGDGTFADVTAASGLAGHGWSGDTVVFDYDEDGAPDVLVLNMFGRSELYHNEGGGRFRPAPRATLAKTSWGSIGGKAFDYDGDGHLDVFTADMHSDMWMPTDYRPDARAAARKYTTPFGAETPSEIASSPSLAALQHKLTFDPETSVFGNTLLRARGDGRFEELSDAAGTETLWPWGVAAGDFDADGTTDVFLTTGMGYPFDYWPPALLMNDGGGRFRDDAVAAGVAVPRGGRYLDESIGGRRAARSSRSVATADFDGDGRLDLVGECFNDVPFLYMNRWKPRHWVELRLRGTMSNRDAIGAVVTIEAGGRTHVRQVDAAGGYLAQSSKTLHFGLGDATKIDRCRIRWPSGVVQLLDGVEVDRRRDVVEGVN